MNKSIAVIVSMVLVGGIGFYLGSYRAKSTNASNLGQSTGVNFSGDRIGSNMGINLKGIRGGGFVAGEIVVLDNKSITVKLESEGSGIVFLTASTTISKEVPLRISDLKIGNTIIVNGTTNQDGSVNARVIQLRESK